MGERDTVSVIAGLERQFQREEIRQRQGGGGRMLDYIDWPTAVRRLNEEVGVDNYDFEVSDLQFTTSAAVCKGRLTIRFPDGSVAFKEQFGGNPFGQGGGGMSPDDAAKGAGSDALKKCAALFGVALDLAEKDAPVQGGGYSGGNAYQNNGGGQQQGYGNQRPSVPPTQQQGFTQSQGQQGSFEGEALYCEECNEPLTETKFRDGTVWSPEQLAVFGRRKHGKVLDMTHYREANTRKRQAEESMQQNVPF